MIDPWAGYYAASDQLNKTMQALPSARQELAMNDMKLKVAQQGLDAADARKKLFSSAADPEELQAALMKSGDIETAAKIQEMRAAQQKAQQDAFNFRHGVLKSAAAAIAQDPGNWQVYVDDAEKQAGVDLSAQRQALAAAKTPEEIKQLAYGAGVELEKLMPKPATVDAGGVVMQGVQDPATGAFHPATTIEKTVPPGQQEQLDQAMTIARMHDETQRRGQDKAASNAALRVEHGAAGLSDEENDALFGENGAVTTGRLDPAKINSRTAKLFARGEMLSPGRTDFVALTGDAAINRNATFRQRAMTAEVLPEIMANMTAAGKKVNYPDNKFAGVVKQWALGAVNDPDLTNYMTQRNDALMTIASVMRGMGMTDQAHRAETEVASPTMSPRALDAWLAAQNTALAPRLKQNRKYTHEKPGAAGGRSDPPPSNAKGWLLHVDAAGNKAYMSPDGSQYEEVP